MTVFAMLGALMYCSKLVLEWAPNIHLLAMFIIAFTVVWRVKALIPIYIFVLLTGIFGGISVWWMPYLYIWTVLWAVTMLLPRRMPPKVAVPVYMVLGALHGLLFGVLCAPSQALFWGLDFKGTVAWIAAGLYFDLLHGIGNLAACTLVVPLVQVIRRIEKRAGRL
ncbi:MAG: hypothetical protein IJW51_00655 [Clostridia bacterium]|nr:hypothetical protein [Clostridia bacterium]